MSGSYFKSKFVPLITDAGEGEGDRGESAELWTSPSLLQYNTLLPCTPLSTESPHLDWDWWSWPSRSPSLQEPCRPGTGTGTVPQEALCLEHEAGERDEECEGYFQIKLRKFHVEKFHSAKFHLNKNIPSFKIFYQDFLINLIF